MASRRILLHEGGHQKEHRPDPAAAWRLVGWFSLLFTLVALSDVVLALYPADLSNAGVRFAVFAGIITGMPLLAIGLVGFLLAGINLNQRGRIVTGTIGHAIAALLILVLLVGFLSARGSAVGLLPPGSEAVMGKTVARTSILGALYLVVHGSALIAGVAALRRPADT